MLSNIPVLMVLYLFIQSQEVISMNCKKKKKTNCYWSISNLMNKIYQHQNNINTKICEFILGTSVCLVYMWYVKKKKRMNTVIFHTVRDSLQGMRNWEFSGTRFFGACKFLDSFWTFCGDKSWLTQTLLSPITCIPAPWMVAPTEIDILYW